ncbi:MAG TPA: aminodeoxychorismate synthase component I [Microbacterium sp.]|uniref:aminodeoxychorismate synthase component I n=1 Tax=Microbacterium sp. TaxID=51671 RepID=UPI002B488145|nr:aminodeoxychorismate synthase component I [Microbacterium sp.]HKT56909.1 aminodeoxychorismate synthase component I [Microbacterium sp.]
MARVLIIDNFDSFTNNIADAVAGVTGTAPIVVDNRMPFDELPWAEVDAVIIGPGPGHPAIPADFGVCREVIERAPYPILGVCLGHQGIAQIFGGTVDRAPAPAHGLVHEIVHDGTGLFAGIPSPFPVVRYHSLAVTAVPDVLRVTARTDDGVVMALEHRSLPIWGVQFHPESVAGGHGADLLRRFTALADEYNASRHAAVAQAFTAVGGVLAGVPHVEELPWPDDPAALYADQVGDADGFWLDSSQPEHPDAGVSVMGAAAVTLTYRLSDRTLTLRGPLGERAVAGDAFTLLGELLDHLDWPGAGPFTAGLAGYLGYELKALCGASETYESATPDAAFVWPAAFVVLDHRTHRAFRHTLAPVGPPVVERAERDETQRADGSAPGVSSRSLALARSTTGGGVAGGAYSPGAVAERELVLRDEREAYLGKIARAQAHILDGDSYEVCLTDSAAVSAPHDPFAAYLEMRRISPVPYGAYLRLGELAVLSASPETFLRVERDGRITTRPIKGTRPRGATPEADAALEHELATSTKDRAENLMIVDLSRHDLGGVCEPGTVDVPELFAVQSFSSVHQLVSTITGRRRTGIHTLDVVRACFPPGSMTGAPKRRTMEIIDELEGAARGPYAGALGWLDASGAAALSVVIRTLVVDGAQASFGVGGAITALSDPEDEFTEILVKASVPHHIAR